MVNLKPLALIKQVLLPPRDGRVSQDLTISHTMIRTLALLVYYGFARHFPTQPMPGWRFGYALRRFLVRHLFESCGEDVIVKQDAYFGDGRSLRVGARAQLGDNCRIDHDVTIGDDVVMGPDVVIMTVGHAFADPERPINQQGALPRRPVNIGRDVWIGTRVVILPGVTVGEGAIVGASSVVTQSIPPYAVAVGNPARVVKWRRPPIDSPLS